MRLIEVIRERRVLPLIGAYTVSGFTHRQWINCCTDGGALTGTLNEAFGITIPSDFIEGMDDWKFLSRNLATPDVLDLDSMHC
jgi:hypothetical protein